MTQYNRNDVWRLKRTLAHLDKALDSLTRAGGELRPKQFESMRARLGECSTLAESLHREMETAIKDKPQARFDLDEDEKEAAE